MISRWEFNMEFSEKDLKLFKEKLPAWQENYMARLEEGYIKLLQSDKSAADKFWALERRIQKDKKKKGVVLQVTRSNLLINLTSLVMEKAITLDELDGFSEELQEAVKGFCKSCVGKD